MMDKNLKNFLIKLVIFASLLFVVRAIFQVPIEYYNLRILSESVITRVFSKGDAMKVIAFAGICFFLAFKSRIEKISHGKTSWLNSALFFISSLLFVGIYYYFNYFANTYDLTQNIELYTLITLKFIALAFAGMFTLISVFQLDYAKEMWKHFWKELVITAILMVVFYLILMFFQAQWRFFSGIVAEVLIASFSPFYKVNALRGGSSGTVITVNDFTIAIAAPCSGIDSMLLFFALFGVIFALDYKHINKGPFIIFFILGIIGDFIVNNIRLFLLILVGVHISPKLAVGLFHTHAGWILFLIYLMGFYWIVKRYIYKKSFTDKK